jgi:hypothetical protein
MQLRALSGQVQQQQALYPGQQQAQQQQLQSGQLDLQEKQKQIADQAKIEKLFADAGNDPEAIKATIPKIMAVNPAMGIQYQKNIMQSQEADISLKKAVIGYHADVAGRIAQVVGGVKDQDSYQKGIGSLLAEGTIDPQTAAQYLSQPFDPAKIADIQQKALSAKDQLELADKKLTEQEKAKLDASEIAKNTAQGKLADVQATNAGQVTPAIQFQQNQENYRATLARAATNANETGKAGIAALQKQGDTYSQFLSTANSLKQSLAAAQNGNEMAAAVAPLQGTLFVTTAEGVKRINQTELQNVAGAGSLIQRIDGALGKQEGKGPLSDTLKNDMAQLVDLYTKSKFDVYQKQAAYTQKLHGLDPTKTPVLDKDGNISEATNAVPAAGKTLSMAQIQQAAKDHNVSVDEATRQAKAAGYTVR